MRLRQLGSVLCLLVLLGGCAGGLNSMENRQYMAYQQDGVLIKEKNPTTGALLGLLPGGGSFYAGKPGLGIVNLLLWPTSVLWDPVSGYRGSRSINYAATTSVRRHKKEVALDALSDRLATGDIDSRQYLAKKHSIEHRYQQY